MLQVNIHKKNFKIGQTKEQEGLSCENTKSKNQVQLYKNS